jgi:hypothetical protein
MRPEARVPKPKASNSVPCKTRAVTDSPPRPSLSRWRMIRFRAGCDRQLRGETAVERELALRRRLRRATKSAKLNGLDPEAYFADVIDRMAKGHSINRIDGLPPWNWQRSRSN